MLGIMGITMINDELFEVTVCDLKDGGVNGKEKTGAGNCYKERYISKD